MPFNANITHSLLGRRFGLQMMSTPQTGGSRGPLEFVAGPDSMRAEVTTADTTGTNIKAVGMAWLQGTSAGSSAVYTIDPPIPGIRKTVFCTTANGPVYLKTANSETIVCTLGSTFTVVKASSVGGAFEMMGVTTGAWWAFITSGTSSQASGFGLTTTT